MSLTTDLTGIHTAKDQTKDAVAGWSKLEYMYRQLVEGNQAIQKIVDDGSFDLIPANLKAGLVDLWSVFQAAQVAIEDNANRTELVNFSPG